MAKGFAWSAAGHAGPGARVRARARLRAGARARGGRLLVSRLEANIDLDADAAGLDVASVSCPAGRAPLPGERFACTATLAAGGTLTYDVTITSEQGAYSYVLAPGQVVDGHEVGTLLTADVTSSSPHLAAATVTCPASVVTPAGHAVFTCQLAVGGSSMPIRVTYDTGQPLTWSF